MSTLRPPSASRSPSPERSGAVGRNQSPNTRASTGASVRPAPILQAAPASPRPGGLSGAGRPTSELLGGAGMFQTPESEAIDQWFENLQNYEQTLEDMAAASLDMNFKEELSAIEQWFRVLSEAERTAALYSLLQQSTHVQIRFFITVLQQMARSDPMTALLSPSMGGSMQSQMEAKLASMGLKSPGLKSTMPNSPSTRNFNPGARQSLALDTVSTNFLSPDAANTLASPGGNAAAAATLAQQRERLKGHRTSAPALAMEGGRSSWAGASQLGQVSERAPSPTQEITVPTPGNNSTSRPKSTDFSGAAAAFRSPRAGTEIEALSPLVTDSWASMVTTPLVPMFKDNRKPGESGAKLPDWSGAGGNRVPLMDNPPKKFRPGAVKGPTDGNANQNNAVYGDDGNLLVPGQQNQQRNLRNGGNGFTGGPTGWNGQPARSPALSNVSSGRFAGSDDGSMNGMGFNGMGLGSPGMGMGMGVGAGAMGMAGLAGMGQLNPFNMNMLNMANLTAMGISPEAQILAAQMAASGFGQPGMGPFGIGMQQQGGRGGRQPMARSPGNKTSANGRGSADAGSKDKDEDVDPALLNDVPGWLRSLRLHKYTPNFEGVTWKEMVVMDEAALEAKGVAALGARRKMLKTFEAVRNKMGVEMPAA